MVSSGDARPKPVARARLRPEPAARAREVTLARAAGSVRFPLVGAAGSGRFAGLAAPCRRGYHATNRPHPDRARDMSKLTGQRILVTGGGSGIGLATARACLREGAHVAITGRNLARLQEAATSLQGGDRLHVHAADLTDAGQAKR